MLLKKKSTGSEVRGLPLSQCSLTVRKILKYFELSWGIQLPLSRHLFCFIVLPKKWIRYHFNDNQDNTLPLNDFSQFCIFTDCHTDIYNPSEGEKDQVFQIKSPRFKQMEWLGQDYKSKHYDLLLLDDLAIK